ncbi:MAG TPA: AI-2E family transporter [Candidatus Paceibacterota bacterium]|nr:AI-2E family transporter [Candidatus Paceibacterota bacterium]
MERETLVISSGSILRVILFVLLFAALFYLRDIALIILTAVVLASAIEPGVTWFKKRGIGRLAAVIIIYLLVAITFVGLFYFFLPPILDDIVGFLGTVPQIVPQELNSLVPSSGAAEFISEKTAGLGDLLSLQQFFDEFRSAVSGISGGVVNATSLVFGGLLSLILIAVLSFYFAVQETGVDDFLEVITPVRHQEYILGLWKRAQFKIGLWMQGQLLLGLIVGVLTYLGLTILGVPYALLFAILIVFFELIPVFGPIIAATPAVIVAFSVGGVQLGLMTAAFYLIVQQFESHLIYPLVVRKVVGVPPILVIISLIVGAKLAGFLGVLISVPVAAAMKEYLDDLQKAKAGRRSIPTPP